MAPTNLEDLRRLHGVSQEDLADAAGIPRTTLRRKLKRPGSFTLDEAAGISLALGVPAESWLEAIK